MDKFLNGTISEGRADRDAMNSSYTVTSTPLPEQRGGSHSIAAITQERVGADIRKHTVAVMQLQNRPNVSEQAPANSTPSFSEDGGVALVDRPTAPLSHQQLAIHQERRGSGPVFRDHRNIDIWANMVHLQPKPAAPGSFFDNKRDHYETHCVQIDSRVTICLSLKDHNRPPNPLTGELDEQIWYAEFKIDIRMDTYLFYYNILRMIHEILPQQIIESHLTSLETWFDWHGIPDPNELLLAWDNNLEVPTMGHSLGVFQVPKMFPELPSQAISYRHSIKLPPTFGALPPAKTDGHRFTLNALIRNQSAESGNSKLLPWKSWETVQNTDQWIVEEHQMKWGRELGVRYWIEEVPAIEELELKEEEELTRLEGVDDDFEVSLRDSVLLSDAGIEENEPESE